MRHLILLLSCLVYGTVMNGQDNSRAGKDYALFFAVEDYNHMGKLTNPIDNATAIADELKTNYGFQTEVVKDPTFAKVAAKIAEYQQKFASGIFDQKGQLLIFFTGHGVQRGNNGYFIPRDGNPIVLYEKVIEYDNWRYEIDQIECQHILVMIDACYSLTFDPNWRNKTDRNFGRRGDKNKDQVRLDHDQYRARLFITSDGTGNQTPDRSSLARQFLAGLRTHRGVNGYLSSEELYASYLRGAAPVPGGGDFGRDEPGSRFLFFQKQTNSRISPQEQSFWDFAVQQHSVPNYQYYLNSFPQGHFRAEAQAAIAKLSKIPVTPGSSSKVPDFMAFIPGGTFRMGDTVEDDMGEEDEKPVHGVSLSDFYLARTEVSVADFARFVDATRYVTDAERDGGSYKWTGEWEKVLGSSWRDNTEFQPRPVAEYEHPVIHVSWNDAIRYCNWLSREHGLEQVYELIGETVSPNWNANGYRLPTEAEWEYAARSGGKDYLYAWGNGDPMGNVLDETTAKVFNLSGEKFSEYTDGYATTAPVGSFPQGRLGLSDITGNVWEWCWDWYARDYYGKSASDNPRGADSGASRVIRGGSWADPPGSCRAANRPGNEPARRGGNVGFRLARSY